MFSVLSFMRIWLNKRQYYFHKDEQLRQDLIQWTETFDDTDLLPTTVMGFRLFVKTLVLFFFFHTRHDGCVEGTGGYQFYVAASILFNNKRVIFKNSETLCQLFVVIFKNSETLSTFRHCTYHNQFEGDRKTYKKSVEGKLADEDMDGAPDPFPAPTIKGFDFLDIHPIEMV